MRLTTRTIAARSRSARPEGVSLWPCWWTKATINTQQIAQVEATNSLGVMSAAAASNALAVNVHRRVAATGEWQRRRLMEQRFCVHCYRGFIGAGSPVQRALLPASKTIWASVVFNLGKSAAATE